MAGRPAAYAAAVGRPIGEVAGGFASGLVHGAIGGWQVGAQQYHTGVVGKAITGGIKGYNKGLAARPAAKAIEAAPADRSGSGNRTSAIMTGEQFDKRFPAKKGSAPVVASKPATGGAAPAAEFSDTAQGPSPRSTKTAPEPLTFSHSQEAHQTGPRPQQPPGNPMFMAPSAAAGAPVDRSAAPARQSAAASFSDRASTSALSHSTQAAGPVPPMAFQAATSSSAGAASVWSKPAGHVMPLSSATLGSTFKPTFSG